MMLAKILAGIVVSTFLIAGSAFARTASPEGAQVYLISPAAAEVAP